MLLSKFLQHRALFSQRFSRIKLLLWAVYILATAQFAGAYYFLESNYLDYNRFEHGYERLPFQTRLFLAPFLRWADNNDHLVKYASRLSENGYFFPNGISPQDIALYFLNIACVLIAGWVAIRLYAAGSQRKLFGELVYPLFLGLCVVTYVLHTVQNYRFVYDLPNLALFSIGLYVIYFRKSPLWLCALFVIATLNRETSLLLLPFYVLSEALDENGNLQWARMHSGRVLGIVLPLAAYWLIWHLTIFHLFRENSSEYYPRITFNILTLRSLRYYPQLFSVLGYLPIFLFLYRRRVRDAQLRVWLWVLPIWLGFMFVWGILIETRIFGELVPYVACVGTILAEEVVAARLLNRHSREISNAYSADDRNHPDAQAA
jgi:hypothetical protein